MSLKVSIVVGNPKPASRTLKVAETLVEKMFPGAPSQVDIIDLALHTDEIFQWPSEKMDALNASVAASDVVVFASPTYKASYTGLLKAFLDRYPSNGLAGVTAIPVFTGGDLTHALAPTVTLATLLAELGAMVPGRGMYFVIGNMDRLDEIVQSAADVYASNLRRLASVGANVADPAPST